MNRALLFRISGGLEGEAQPCFAAFGIPAVLQRERTAMCFRDLPAQRQADSLAAIARRSCIGASDAPPALSRS